MNQPVGDSTASTDLRDLASLSDMDAEALLDLESTEFQSTIKPDMLGTRIRHTSPRQVDIWALGDELRRVTGIALISALIKSLSSSAILRVP